MVQVLHLFPKLNSSLIDLLSGLTPTQWNSPTICKQWSVKDIAAHLLDTALRRISSGRDEHFQQISSGKSYEDILEFINMLNDEWVSAYKRVSPHVLINQLSSAQNDLFEYLLSLDLAEAALYPVTWAGEEESQTWFDIAREYTERWHHQQQIRLAVGSNSLLERELYYPFLEISMLALPFHYRSKVATEGAKVRITVVGDSGGSWSIIRTGASWNFTDSETDADTQVYIDQNIAWMLLSKGIDIFEAEQYWQISGDYELGFHALKMKAFMV